MMKHLCSPGVAFAPHFLKIVVVVMLPLYVLRLCLGASKGIFSMGNIVAPINPIFYVS